MSDTHSHTACAVFTFKDQESKEKFIEFCNGENGLGVTRGWKGCRSIDCYEAHGVRYEMVFTWHKTSSHQDSKKREHVISTSSKTIFASIVRLHREVSCRLALESRMYS